MPPNTSNIPQGDLGFFLKLIGLLCLYLNSASPMVGLVCLKFFLVHSIAQCSCLDEDPDSVDLGGPRLHF